MSLIDEYINKQVDNVQPVLREVHRVIKSVLPDAIEQMKYGMPTYHQKQNLIHFAANKNHLGIYPTPSAILAFQDRLGKYKFSKGAIQFPYDDVDFMLIRDMAIYRLNQVLNGQGK